MNEIERILRGIAPDPAPKLPTPPPSVVIVNAGTPDAFEYELFWFDRPVCQNTWLIPSDER